MNNLFQRYKWAGILLGVLLLIAGIATIVLGIVSPGQINLILSIIVAVILFIIGALYIIAGCMLPLNNFFSTIFLYGALAIAIGVVLLINTGIVPSIMVYTLSIVLIALGAIYLCRAIIGIVHHAKVMWIVLCFILAVLGITAGVLSLVYNGQVLTIIYIAVGAVLAAAGIAQIIYSARR